MLSFKTCGGAGGAFWEKLVGKMADSPIAFIDLTKYNIFNLNKPCEVKDIVSYSHSEAKTPLKLTKVGVAKRKVGGAEGEVVG